MAVRVVVVEDSEVQRARLVVAVQSGGQLEVVGEAGSVAEAVRVVAATQPDVVTMDLELPGGRSGTPGGPEAIRQILEGDAVPILLLSAYVVARTDTAAIEALAAGAVDVFPKAQALSEEGAAALRRRLLVLSRVQMVTRRPRGARPARPKPAIVPGRAGPVLALAASTGGPSALRTVILGLGPEPLEVPILVVQHIHPDFSTSFADWLGGATGLRTGSPEHGERLQPGRVYVAPARQHLRLAADGTAALGREPATLSMPSCDELLSSVALHAGPRAVGAVLTGMGDDGAAGLLALRDAGGVTFAQDGASAVVDGMPRAARERGAADHVLPLDELGPALAAAVRKLRR